MHYNGLDVTRLHELPQAPERFPATAWTVIHGAQAADEQACRRALDRLISVYWRPVYSTLRLDWSVPPEEAKDLTQEYFSVFLEKHMIDRVAPAHGRFRAYVIHPSCSEGRRTFAGRSC